MNEFDWDVVQKKRIARGARYTNVKKPGCTLPSDNLTAGQIKKLHGEVRTVKMDEPITWEEWKALPKDLAEEYYAGLIDRFSVGQNDIAQMMGCPQSTFSRYCSLGGYKLKKNMERATQSKREIFWQWARPTITPSDPDSYEPTAEETQNPIKETPQEKTPQSGTQSVKTAWLDNYYFRWSEVSSWDEIVTFIKNMPLPEHGYVELTVKGA